MHRFGGIEVLKAVDQARSRTRDPRTEAAICRLEWVLCVAFDDIGAVEDAYRAVTDAGEQFEAASGDIERAYDRWLAAARRVSDASPGWGMPSGGSIGAALHRP